MAVAEHRILSWQIGNAGAPLEFRVELYEKRYDNLPLDDGEGSYVSVGDGNARCGDLYFGFRSDAGHSNPLLRDWRGFVAYTYLDAQRRYTAWQDQGRYDIPEHAFDPDFAIPHSVQVVVHRALPFNIDASLGLRYATGRPFTPVTGASATEFGWLPSYATINSDRLPDYQRIDLSASRSFQANSTTSALVYIGINDLADRRNAFRYVYSPDFTMRRVARTAFGRTFYFGVTFRR